MAVITTFYRTREDGVKLYRTYSTLGVHLVREDGVEFDEAVDVENSGHTYTEAEVHPDEEITAEEALRIIIGGGADETE